MENSKVQFPEGFPPMAEMANMAYQKMQDDANGFTKQTYENTSGLVPLGRAVLIAPYEVEKKEGLILLTESVKGRDMMVEQRATVVAIGECAWDDERVPRAKPGDLVLVTKFAGYMAVGTADGKQYRLVNDRDIFARIEKEGE